MSRLTLEKIAALAGVSRSTVSRVINDQVNVRPEVRERVQQVIVETGYQPNQAARSLASKRSTILGLVIPRNVQSVFADPYFPRLIQGISLVCNENDYVLSLFLFHTEDEENKIYPRVLNQGFVDGVIITSMVSGDTLLDQLKDSDMPFVAIGRTADMPDVSYVDVDNVGGATTAVTHLINLGYKHIATIAGPADVRAAIDRLQGYTTALTVRGLQIDPDLIVRGDFSEASGYAAMQQLLSHSPDAVFAASDAMAQGALRALREAQIGVPDTIAIVGFDDLTLAALEKPALTTVRQPIQRVGKLAAENLLDMLQNGVDPPRRLLLPTELVIRDSCGKKG